LLQNSLNIENKIEALPQKNEFLCYEQEINELGFQKSIDILIEY